MSVPREAIAPQHGKGRVGADDLTGRFRLLADGGSAF